MDFKAVAATNLGTDLSETKEVEQNECAKIRRRLEWVETVHGIAGEARRKLGHRNRISETEN
jgi:hypothetical protein